MKQVILTPILDRRIKSLREELQDIPNWNKEKKQRIYSYLNKVKNWKQILIGEIGDDVGMVCNRNGCSGLLTEMDVEGSCSCHINAPCGTCERMGMWECILCGEQQEKTW